MDAFESYNDMQNFQTIKLIEDILHISTSHFFFVFFRFENLPNTINTLFVYSPRIHPHHTTIPFLSSFKINLSIIPHNNTHRCLNLNSKIISLQLLLFYSIFTNQREIKAVKEAID